MLFTSTNYIFSSLVIGTVKDKSSGKALSGAVVKLEGTAYGAITNKSGEYSIKRVPKGKQNVLVSYIGYKTEKVHLDIIRDSTYKIDFLLNEQVLKTGEIVISANRRIQSVQEVPISISVLEKKEILSRAPQKIDEALEYVPGVEVNKDDISIRGSAGFAFGLGSRVTLLMDGFPLISADNGDVKSDMIPLVNIERVEIVKGAGSALYGTSAMGGVINILTEEAKEEPLLKIRSNYGFYTKPRYKAWDFADNLQTKGGIDGVWSKKFVSLDKSTALGITLSGSYDEDMSYKSYDDSRRWSLYTKVLFIPGDLSEFSFTANLSSSNRADWVYWNSLDSATKPPANTNYNSRFQSDKYTIFGSYKRILSDKIFMVLRTGIFSTDIESILPKDDSDYRQSKADNINSEAQINIRLNENFLITSGLCGVFNQVESKIYGNQNQNIFSIYSQAEYGMMKKMIFNAGLRADFEKADNIDANSEFSPKIGFSWAPIEDLNIRASYGHGFRAPQTAERHASLSFQGFEVKPNLDLKPETSETIETGFNYSFSVFNIPFYIDGAVYFNSFNNLIEPNFTEIGVSDIQFKNITKAEIFGTEFVVKTFLPPFFGLETGITWSDPQDKTNNKPLKYRSKTVWYSRLFIPSGDFLLSIDYRYKSKTLNIDPALKTFIKDADARVPMHLVDANIRWAAKNLLGKDIALSIIAKNLFDYYYTEMVGNLYPTRSLIIQMEWNY